MEERNETTGRATGMSTFSYNGTPVSFMGTDSIIVNATEMARPFGKRTNDWLSNEQTKNLIISLSAKTGIPATGLVSVNQGGSNPGTWLHQDLAIVFAQWLSPEFYIWCNERIKELVRTGITTLTAKESRSEDEVILHAMQLLQQRLATERERTRMLSERNEALAPKAQYADECLLSTSSYTATQMAKSLDMTVVAFNRRLKALGVQFQQSGQWMLAAKHQGKGYTKTRVAKYVDGKTNEVKSSQSMVWTEKGRLFLHALLGKGGKA